MKAAQRRAIADRLAVMAVDETETLTNGLPCDVFPEELLGMQHALEELFYAELAKVTA